MDNYPDQESHRKESQTLPKKMMVFFRILYRRLIFILIIFSCIGLGIALSSVYYLSNSLIDSQSLQQAKISAIILNKARTSYSEKVVDRAKEVSGVEVSAMYHDLPGGIPNPATYTIELGKEISSVLYNTELRLYSNYPFPNRQETGGPKDKFEQDALDYLVTQPDKSFQRKERFDGHLRFRYAEPILMEQSCVNCHNRLPESPRKNWEVGDVRGVIAINQSLDDVILIAHNGFRFICVALAILTTLGLAGLFLVIGRLRYINQELKEKVQHKTAQLHQLAIVDELTQLANRRQFDGVLRREWYRTQRQQQPLSLILGDIDYFKHYNDTYGHLAGDACLYAVAQAIHHKARRSGDLVARYGGEEFAVILSNTPTTNAEGVADKILEAVRALKIEHERSQVSSYITLSLGVATLVPQAKHSPLKLIEMADQALYTAKEQGRNQFVSTANLSQPSN